MTSPASLTRPLTALSLWVLCLTGCFEDPVPMTTASTSDGTTGDGDGDPTTTGDGDGDTTTSDGTTGDGDGDGDPATTTGDAPCMGECIPEPGPAWDGPFAVGDGCSGAYPSELETLLAGIDAGEPSCACECGVPQVNCSTSMSAIGYAANNCVNGQGAEPISQNQCYNTFSSSHGVSLGNASATCGPGSVVEDIPEPTFATVHSACGEFEVPEGMCEAGALCVPAPDGFDGGLCYSSPGDVGCPAGYPNKELYSTGFEDTRSCAADCSCSATGATCTVSIVGFGQDNCVSAQGMSSVDSGAEVCAAISQVVQSIRPGTVSVKNPGTCAPQPNIPTMGEVTETGQLTVCCSG